MHHLPTCKRSSSISSCITYELLSYAIKRSNNIVSLFKELENIRLKYRGGSLAGNVPKLTGVLA
jgi:hypothetical protein